MSDTAELLLCLGIVGALVLALVGLRLTAARKARTRRPRMEACARGLGLSFDATGSSFDFDELASFSAFSPTASDPGRGQARRARHVMRGSRDGFDVVVLDYHDDHDDYTLVGLRSPSWTLPTFRLEPRVGTPDSGDIVVESHPDFSRTYSLVTGDEPATRAAFTPGVLDHLSTRKGLVVEGSGQRLVVWRLFENTEPAAIPALVEQALAIARLLRSP